MYLKQKEVAKRYSVNPVTIARWVKAGIIPEPREIAPGLLRWSIKDLEDYEKTLNRGNDE